MTTRTMTRHFQLTAEPGIGWFRLFGKGLAWKDTRRHHLLFSERNGYVKYVMVGRWVFFGIGRQSPSSGAGENR